ncbi:helix-turn-helix domain-containing protein [Bacteroidales bacterium OttesenSCG-928-A17]|nr:helix-turn-helix domain-containing protein [Bacteroidales bacterium OttesenSCG-928-A17]
MLKDIIILSPFLVSLFWIIHFFSNRKRNSRSQNIWAIALGLMTITGAIHAFYWYIDENSYSLFYKLDIIECFSTLLFIPMLFLYFRELTGDKDEKSRWKIALLFIPPLLFSVASASFYLLTGEEYATLFTKLKIESNGTASVESIPYHQILWIINEYTYSLLFSIQAVVVVVYAIRRLIIYRNHLCDFFSDIEGKDTKYYWAVLGGLLIFLTVVAVSGLSGYMLYTEYSAGVSVFLLLYGGCIYFMCFHVFRTQYTAADFEKELALSDAEEYPKISREQSNSYTRILSSFNKLIDEDKIFLRKDLRVDTVARLIYTNRTYISRMLREEYQCNFWEFINRKRIEYAKEQTVFHPALTQEEIARISGFTHNSAFSRAFKEYERTTFREWRKTL